MGADEIDDRDRQPTLADLWPPFRVELRSGDLTLRLPHDDELPALAAVAARGITTGPLPVFSSTWADEPSPKLEQAMLQWHWHNRAAWKPDRWWWLAAIFVDGEPVGAQDLFAARFATMRTVGTASWLGRQWQGRGIGTRMRRMMLEFAFAHLDARLARTEAMVHNDASNAVSRRLGYTLDGTMELAPRATPYAVQRYRLDRDAWLAGPHRISLEVRGLDADVRQFFDA